jgi:hypothetical protein
MAVTNSGNKHQQAINGSDNTAASNNTAATV